MAAPFSGTDIGVALGAGLITDAGEADPGAEAAEPSLETGTTGSSGGAAAESDASDPPAEDVADAGDVTESPVAPAPYKEILELHVPEAPGDTEPGMGFETGGQVVKQPFAIKNSFILILEPTLTADEFSEMVDEKGFTVTNTIPAIGGVEVEWDTTEYFSDPDPDASPDENTLRALVKAASNLTGDARIVTAAPNTFIGQFDTLPNLLKPELEKPSAEVTDWAIDDVKAAGFWDQLLFGDVTYIGVMDVGFHKHEDLWFQALAPDARIHDHGNHVAGIACAMHDNVRGVKGVLPRCIVVPDTADYLRIGSVVSGVETPALGGAAALNVTDRGAVNRWAISFGQVLGRVSQFVDTHPQIRTFNLSMGYNWIPNFGINPDDQQSADIRAIVPHRGPPSSRYCRRRRRTAR